MVASGDLKTSGPPLENQLILIGSDLVLKKPRPRLEFRERIKHRKDSQAFLNNSEMKNQLNTIKSCIYAGKIHPGDLKHKLY